MSKSATRASAESTPPNSSMKKTHRKQTRDKPRGAPKAAWCDVWRKRAVPSKACSDKECSTSHDFSRDDGEGDWGAHSRQCALPKLTRIEGKARGEKMNPVGRRIGPHLMVN